MIASGTPSSTPNGRPSGPIADSAPMKPPNPATAAPAPASSVIQPMPLRALAQNLATAKLARKGGRSSSPWSCSRETTCGSLLGCALATGC